MIEREIHENGELVITRCFGQVTGEELISSAHWMIRNFGDRIKPGFSQLFDALDADTEQVSEDDIHRVAHINLYHGRNRGSFSMAILAVLPYPRALARLHKLLAEPADIRVEIFSDRKQAFQWLGKEDPRVNELAGIKKPQP